MEKKKMLVSQKNFDALPPEEQRKLQRQFNLVIIDLEARKELRRLKRDILFKRIWGALGAIVVIVIWFLMCDKTITFFCGVILVVVMYLAIFTDFLGTDDGGR